MVETQIFVTDPVAPSAQTSLLMFAKQNLLLIITDKKHVLLFVLGFEMNRPCLCSENSATSVNQPETNHTYESYMGFALTHYFAPFQCCTLNLSPRSELLVASISCLQTDVHVANRQVAASGYYRYCFQVSTLL